MALPRKEQIDKLAQECRGRGMTVELDTTVTLIVHPKDGVPFDRPVQMALVARQPDGILRCITMAGTPVTYQPGQYR